MSVPIAFGFANSSGPGQSATFNLNDRDAAVAFDEATSQLDRMRGVRDGRIANYQSEDSRHF